VVVDSSFDRRSARSGGTAVRPIVGDTVQIVKKDDQRSGRLTHGVVETLLTRKQFHPHGIKVRLSDGSVGRVQEIVKL
jgi:uncharacterized repeat protein (TIGR03833 family)